MSLLKINNLCMNFEGLAALVNVNLEAKKNEIVALIGPNGAGKTTMFNCITGIYAPVSGEIFIKNSKYINITGLKSNKITENGLARTFQNIRLFQNMTVLENVMIGHHSKLKSGIFGAVFKTKKTRKEEADLVDYSYNILKKIGLEKHVNDLAKNLPYGAQRRLEIARALATEPFLLLLDEPAAGMNPKETGELDELIVKLKNSENISILLIEHDMNLIMSLSDRIYVMDYGKMIAEGSPEKIKNDPKVIEAYLGENVNA